MSANRIDATLTDAQRDRANAALDEALPFLIRNYGDTLPFTPISELGPFRKKIV